MKTLTIIEGARAWARAKGGTFKQLDVYRRGDRLFVRNGSGFVRLEARFDERYPTSNPDLVVLELDVDGLRHDRNQIPFA